MRNLRFATGMEVDQLGDITIARLTDDVPEAEAAEEIDHLTSLVNDGTCSHVVVNFGEVNYLPSILAARFFALYRAIQARGGRLLFSNVSPFLNELFAVINLGRLIPIFGDETAAIDAVQDADAMAESPAGR